MALFMLLKFAKSENPVMSLFDYGLSQIPSSTGRHLR